MKPQPCMTGTRGTRKELERSTVLRVPRGPSEHRTEQTNAYKALASPQQNSETELTSTQVWIFKGILRAEFRPCICGIWITVLPESCGLIKKAGDGSKKIKGCWDSIHVVEVQEKSSGRTAHYKLTSTVMLWLQTTKTGSGTMNLGGSLTRQMEKDETVSESSPHIANIGRLVEDMENKIRSTLNEIYFGKTKDIVNGLRSIESLPDNQKYRQLQRELSQVLTQRQIFIE
ncbi:hypothetical protein MHYP_G00265170 [Metynnis hypsauchen]